MFKLVIVEDEDNIRHSLEAFIPWSQMGFQVVGAFCDGSDALDYIIDHPCDVVLTDILMSRMSGLELIARLQEICPETKTVILSGHSDFAYAQQAIQYHVIHYLVKPVDEDELMDVFKNIKAQLDLEHTAQDSAEAENRDLKLMLQKSFFRDLLGGRVASEDELSAYLKLLGFAKVDKTSPLVAFEIREVRQRQAEDPNEVQPQISEEMLIRAFPPSSAFYAFMMEQRMNRWRVVFVGSDFRDAAELRKVCSQKLQSIADGSNGTMAFHLTHAVTSISDLLADAKNPKTLLSQQAMDSGLCQSAVADYKLLIVELDLGSEETLLHILNGLLLDLQDTPLDDTRFILKNLYSLIELNYRKRKISVWNLTNGSFSANHLYDAADMEAIATCVRSDFAALCNCLRKRKQSNDHSIVSQVMQFLLENIDKDISHDVIAAKYRIHPGYLSRLFKQDTGETLSEYLLRIKIERAAVLLKEGRHKIGDIAGMVGYSASSYFSIAFKKYTGCSPREYSQRILM